MAHSNDWRPVAEIQDKTLSFIALTRNGKWLVLNEKTANDWLISKYAITHYMIPKPPTDGTL